jgi:hypothetical protein
MCLAAHVLALILPVVSSGQEEYEWKWVLERADPDGVRAAADGATLAHAYQVAGETFIEAERPSGPVVGVETVTDNEASGGTYLVVPEGAGNGPTAELICVLDVRAPGTYDMWVRTRWPTIGSNSLFVALDSAEMEVLGNTEGPEVIDPWHWCRGPSLALDGERHTLRLWWREDGTELDKLALLPQGSPGPSGLGPTAGRPAFAEHGTLTTPDFSPPSVDRWGRLVVEGDRLDLVGAEVSADSGETWDPAEINAALRGLAGRQVRVRLHLSRQGDAVPTVTSVAVTYIGQPYALELGNQHMRLTFMAETGELIGAIHVPTGVELLPEPVGKPPFGLRVWSEELGRIEDLRLDGCRCLGVRTEAQSHPRTLVLPYSVRTEDGHVRVTCRVTLGADEPIALWQTRIENHLSGLAIVEVLAPVARGLRVGRSADDDVLIWPRWAGFRIPHPAAHPPGFAAHLGGRATMSWMDLHNSPTGPGLYLAAYDKTAGMHGLRAEGASGGRALDCSMSAFTRIEPGGSFTTEPFALGIHGGDWHEAADLYRGWLHSWLEPADTPQWLRDSDGWLGTGRPSSFLNDLPARYRFARSLGLSHTQWWGQMMAGKGAGESCCNRLYFPDPRYGTEDEFHRAIETVRSWGGHIGFYTNGQAWNPRYPAIREDLYAGLVPSGALIPDWEAGFSRNALVQADGSFVPQYAKPADDDSPYAGLFYLMCPGSRGWRQYLRHYIVDKYARQYGADVMYVDQVGAAPAQLCFARGHGHDRTVGGWAKGFLGLFAELRRGGRKHEPDFALATEGFGDLHGQFVDIFLISPASTGAWPYSAPEVVRYTLPEYLCYDGFANGRAGGERTNEEIVNEVFLLGSRFDIFTGEGDFADYVRKVIRLRQETKEWLYRSRFMDERGLATSGQGLRAKLFTFDADDAAGALVTIHNPANLSDGAVSVHLRGLSRSGRHAQEPRVYAADLGSPLSPVAPQIDGNAVRVAAPKSTLSTVLILERSPEVTFRASVGPAVVGSKANVRVRILPLRGEAVSGRIGVRGSGDWPVEEAAALERDFTVGAPEIVQIPLWVPEGVAPGFYPIEVHYERADACGRDELWLDVTPPIEATAHLAGGQIVLNVRALGEAPVPCEASFDVEGVIRVADGTRRFEAGPGEEGVAVSMPVVGPLEAAGRVLVTVSAPGYEVRRQVTVPPLNVSPAHWRTRMYEGDVASESRDDQLVIRSSSLGDRGGWGIDTARLRPGSTVMFAVECRTEEVVSAERGALIRAIFFHRDGTGRASGDWEMTEAITGTTAWRTLAVDFTVPPDTGRVQLELFNWHAAGTSYWRNPSVTVH